LEQGDAAVTQLLSISSRGVPALVTAAGERARIRFLEFFGANIRNPHTRRAITERPTSAMRAALSASEGAGFRNLRASTPLADRGDWACHVKGPIADLR
jgi:hypothetical protein